MFTALSTLHFAQLGMFALALATPLLLLAYLRRTRERRQIVSSIFLLQKLSQKVTVRKRIRLPLRFFIELLALLLLILAAANPFLRTEGERVAIILDNSLSMTAQLPGTIPSGTRFTRAREELTRILSNRHSGDRYSLYVTAPHSMLVGERYLPRPALEQAVGSVTPALTSDTLPALLQELAHSGEYDRIVVVTDQELSLSDGESSKGISGEERTPIEVTTLGVPIANWYVSGIRLERGDLNDPAGSVVALLGLSGNVPVRVSAILSSRTASTERPGQELARKSVTLQPGRDIEVRFPLSQFRGERTFRVELEPASADRVENAIRVDDFGFVASDSTSEINLLLVTPDAARDGTLGLNTIPGVSVTPLTPTEFVALSNAELGHSSAIIFHRVAPRTLPEVPSLFILPPNTNILFPVKNEAHHPVVSSWNTSHPLTQYLRVPLLNPDRTLLFEVPSWAQSVINVELGSVLLAGEKWGNRFAAVGFELLPFEGIRSPVFSILTLNALTWLTSGSEFGSGFITGSSIRLEAGKSWAVQYPDERVTSLQNDPTSPYFFILNSPGIYDMVGGGVETGNRKVKVRKSVAVNAFHPEESDTFNVRALELPRDPRLVTARARPLSPLWPYLVTGGILLLILEYLLRFRPREVEI